MGSLKVGQDWETSLSIFPFTHWRRKWQPTPAGWRIPGTGEPGELPSMGSHRVGHDWNDLASMFLCSPGFSTSPFLYIPDPYGFCVYHVIKMMLTMVTRGLLISNIMTSSYHDLRFDHHFPPWNRFFGSCTTSLPGFLISFFLWKTQTPSPYFASYPDVNHCMTWKGGKYCVWVKSGKSVSR